MGTLYLAIGYLAHSYRRMTAVWVVAQVAAVFLTIFAGVIVLPMLFGGGLVWDAGLLLVVLLVAALR